MPILPAGDLRRRPARLPDDVDTARPWSPDVDTLGLSERPGTAPMSLSQVEGMYQ
ncbi:MAG: hypothetical protein M0Z54_15190 [Thermaerobacter sp.]|nr:hypothetical protein [Thermaerobacter sp.]